MKREDLDLKLKEALNTAAENIVPPEDMFDRIEKRIESCEYKEEKNMKMNFKFKVAVVAAAICAFSVTGFALGRINSWTSHSSNEEIPYEQLVDMEKESGINIKSVEKFSNGFEFVSAGTGETQAADADGNTVGKSNQISVSYRDKEGKAVVLSARNIINGEDLSSVDKYDFHKMVTFPGDKEEETDKNEIAEYEAKGYWVSYGSVDEKVESAFESLCWTDGNIIYNLGGIDTEIGEDGMKAMKNEIMKAE